MAAYITRAEGTTYFTLRLNSAPWDGATDGDKDKSLTQATMIIDQLNFRGEKTDEAQVLQFPRYDDSVIPQDIQNACAEIALALLDGVDPELEFENLTMVSQGYGPVKSTYNRSALPEHKIAGVPSMMAWRYLKPYLRDHRTVDLSRVS